MKAYILGLIGVTLPVILDGVYMIVSIIFVVLSICDLTSKLYARHFKRNRALPSRHFDSIGSDTKVDTFKE